MQTLWCVLRKDTTGVDTARVRRRLNYKNTEVEFPESLAAVDITCRHNGLRCRYSGLGRVDVSVLVLNALVLSVDISVLILNALILSVDISVLVLNALVLSVDISVLVSLA